LGETSRGSHGMGRGRGRPLFGVDLRRKKGGMARALEGERKKGVFV